MTTVLFDLIHSFGETVSESLRATRSTPHDHKIQNKNYTNHLRQYTMMKFAEILLFLIVLAPATCFSPTSMSQSSTRSRLVSSTSLSAYVPDGLTDAQYQKIKAQDKKKVGKDLGRLGPRGFKSRSMQAWQEAYEKGMASHAFAPFGYREQLKKGELKLKDVPYMVRGGNWDNSDVLGAKRLAWTSKDREYARGGFKKEQSASILGSGPGFDWTGQRPRDENLRNKFVPGLS